MLSPHQDCRPTAAADPGRCVTRVGRAL